MAVSFCGKRIILTRSSLLKTPRRNGYIVLVPEIGEDLPGKNPLLKDDGFPEFNRLSIEKCVAAIGKQSVEFEQGVRHIGETIEKMESPDIFNDVLNPMDDLAIPLDTTWGLAKTLYLGNQSLMPTKCYMNIHERARNARSSKYIIKPIYQACKNAKEDGSLKMTEEQRRLVSKFALEGKLNGFEVAPSNMDSFNLALFKIRERQTEFSDKLKVATEQFNHIVSDPNVVKDFPLEFLKSIAVDSSQPEKGPWKITLQSYIKNTFLEYCPDRNLRCKVWVADRQRSVPWTERHVATSVALEHLRDARARKAKYLGYKSYTHMSMETKMAGSVENIYNVLDSLLETAWPAQLQELDTLKSFAYDRGFESNLQLWDVPYWSRKQRTTLHGINEAHLQEYFPLPQVLSSLFKLLERLFDIKFIERKTADVWHQDVRLIDIVEGNEIEPIASFYLDPYARQNEKVRIEESSGWMVAIRNRSTITQTNPLAALIFNFQPPHQDKPSLLTFKDLQVLFAKFGHALQHLLTKTNHCEVAGFSNVEWDAVGISSNFILNWLYEYSTLKDIGTHYKTGESLPKEIIEGLANIRSHMAGYTLCKELYLSRLDLELHLNADIFWLDLVKKLWKNHFAFALDKRDGHVCSFEDIFSGDWGAAYYSHLWAQMVAADAYSAFQEVAPGDEQQQAEIGKRFKDTFLSSGGACHPSEVFRRFRGRDPSPNALIKNLGLKSQDKIH
ncbi:probable cytosolic oligopeptidase A [Neodiprion lecontei]|uniref:Probable cytosolic oligopeptidase A n=1 Tax=Neodiprion lecontei TaxID=441921 RepID=A0A6J0C9E8_NEOLC|nr:probable cytosolic oligopeptidase A [Neodiprion lecontei]